MVTALRRGLPRVRGGEPWPPADAGPPVETTAAAAVETPAPAPVPGPTQDRPVPQMRRGLPRVRGGEPWPPVHDVPAAAAQHSEPDPAPTPQPEPAPEPTPAPAPAVERGGEREGVEKRKLTWGRYTAGAVGLVVLLAMVVMSARYILLTEWGAGFVARYDGVPTMPAGAPEGFPVWLNALHLLNFFLMVLIIRTGMGVRREQKPAAYFTPRGGGKKISLTLWLHQCLDALWVATGAVFYILLFSTGQWMRIVPTSWDVFPNAVSAGLQYLTLDWPVENGWVHYNGLQLLAYFTTVFIAAPLAIISGVRMSGLWNEKWERLSRAYPAPVARAIHFPVMLYFLAFIVIHVVLVIATGALRNLNHMFAARGSADPTEYAGDWTGLIIFAVSLVVLAGLMVAARPALIAPLARLRGEVTAR
ncbi:cytochrome b/b6 domain-containing protein [Corynebacterium sp. LK2510]|uniref:cytochrome b/b6 domain-containing protein n=1 Tax=Corynebacterium sp. LK2510 TaxID=3110472 RepID=UPI0034CD82DE